MVVVIMCAKINLWGLLVNENERMRVIFMISDNEFKRILIQTHGGVFNTHHKAPSKCANNH